MQSEIGSLLSRDPVVAYQETCLHSLRIWTRRETHGNDITPSSPLIEQLRDGLKTQPVAPCCVDDKGLVERSQEEDGSQQERLRGLGQADGPVAHGVERVRIGGLAFGSEEHKGHGRGGDAGEGHRSDACSDDGWCIPGEGPGRPGRSRQVERQDVEERVEHLGRKSIRPSHCSSRPWRWPDAALTSRAEAIPVVIGGGLAVSGQNGKQTYQPHG
jgi:hypothetical protein